MVEPNIHILVVRNINERIIKETKIREMFEIGTGNWQILAEIKFLILRSPMR